MYYIVCNRGVGTHWSMSQLVLLNFALSGTKGKPIKSGSFKTVPPNLHTFLRPCIKCSNSISMTCQENRKTMYLSRKFSENNFFLVFKVRPVCIERCRFYIKTGFVNV